MFLHAHYYISTKTHCRFIINVGPGSCHGDSGGPLYKYVVSDKGVKIPVLLGTTSLGTSRIGNCGGINNPTHYVRIQKLLGWINRYVNGKYTPCFVDGKGHMKKVSW